MSTSTKPARGFRDFLPDDTRLRSHVFGVITDVYRAYGFEQLDTPCIEPLSTLLGKYGDEGDQLLFRILKRGDKLRRAIDGGDANDNTLADLGLRYDLTVPLARVYAQYRNDFPRVFKRFQIAPVWRADRPQRGRFREFYQCDVDIIGSSSMAVEAEVTSALAEILQRLKFEGFRIHVNHRGVLNALLRTAGVPDEKATGALVAIDKLDKIGEEGVQAELQGLGLSQATIDALAAAFEQSPDNATQLQRMADLFAGDEPGTQALGELQELVRLAAGTPAGPHLVIDTSLARGLSYYTGPIFEIRSDDFSGSLGGGGRYDELIGMFMKENVPACGFSLGVERILMLMRERGMQAGEGVSADVMLATFDQEGAPGVLALAATLRAAGLRVDVYPDAHKLGKQFKYADQRGIGLVVVEGPSERDEGMVNLKDMSDGSQRKVTRHDLADVLHQILGRA